MTRNEWIAETAKLSYVDSKTGTSFALIVTECVDLADALEAANVAPWKDAATQARATIAYEVEDGVHIAGHLWPKTGDAAFTRRAVAAINAACNAPALTDTAAKVVEAAESWNDSDWNDHATCPYCGHVEADSWEIDFGTNGSAEVTCSVCEKDYHCQQHVILNYSSSRKGGAS